MESFSSALNKIGKVAFNEVKKSLNRIADKEIRRLASNMSPNKEIQNQLRGIMKANIKPKKR